MLSATLLKIIIASLHFTNINAATFIGEKSEEILCERAPTAYLVGEAVPAKPVPSSNPCNASAKIQAIAYECGELKDNFSSTQNFFKLITKKAHEKCDEYCKSVNAKCTGRFVDQSSCGLSVPATRSLDVGKNVVNCPATSCKGQSFNYCSLYYANFFATDPDLFLKLNQNCYCKRKTK